MHSCYVCVVVCVCVEAILYFCMTKANNRVVPSFSGGGVPTSGAFGRSALSPSSKGGGVGRDKVGGVKLGAAGAAEMSTFQVPAEVCVLVVCACVRACMCVCMCVCMRTINLVLRWRFSSGDTVGFFTI